ncbi:MAG: DUF6526 family protein [Gemmatimonas sp.]
MSDTADQSFSNHTKWMPLYHFVAAPLGIVLLVWNVKHVIADPNSASVLGLLTAVLLVVLIALVRVLPLKVQDRLIRLEEQLRLMRLLPADLQSRIGEFSVHQLVALRFASDAELPELARRVLDENLTSRKAVKTEIRKWRPDTFRV